MTSRLGILFLGKTMAHAELIILGAVWVWYGSISNQVEHNPYRRDQREGWGMGLLGVYSSVPHPIPQARKSDGDNLEMNFQTKGSSFQKNIHPIDLMKDEGSWL